MEITLDKAAPEDLNLLLPLVAAYHEFEQLDSTDADRESAVKKLISTPQIGGIWLVYCAKELAGYIALCRGYSIEFNGFDGFIDEFFLGRAYRGKGIGKAVLQAVRAEAAKLEINTLHLEVARENHSAQKLYRNAGFKSREKYLLMSLELNNA